MDMVVVLVEREWEIDVPIGFSESFSKMTIWSRDSIILLKLSNTTITLVFVRNGILCKGEEKLIFYKESIAVNRTHLSKISIVATLAEQLLQHIGLFF